MKKLRTAAVTALTAVSLGLGAGVADASPLVLNTPRTVDNADALHASLQIAVEKFQKRMVEDRAKMTFLPAEGVFTSGFGPRWGTFHAGIDIANATYTPIRATKSGVVLESGPAGGYGTLIRILHDDGYTSAYGHMETLNVVAGQRVNAGDVIAGMGTRGFSTGPHLHFEIIDPSGVAIDPLAWLNARGVYI